MTLPAFVEQGGGDTAVLLLHGIGGGASIWSDAASGTLREIAGAGYRAVAVDLPGYGGSAAMGAPDLDTMVGAVRSLIGHLAPGRTVLLGHSMGGMVAQACVAGASPVAVHGLVLACTTAAFGKAGGAWQAQFIAERLAPLEAGLCRQRGELIRVVGNYIQGLLSDRSCGSQDGYPLHHSKVIKCSGLTGFPRCHNSKWR